MLRYLPPIGIGDVIRSSGIGEVVESNSDRYRVGDLVLGMVGWQDQAVAGASASEGAGAMQAIPPGLDAPTALTCSASRA